MKPPTFLAFLYCSFFNFFFSSFALTRASSSTSGWYLSGRKAKWISRWHLSTSSWPSSSAARLSWSPEWRGLSWSTCRWYPPVCVLRASAAAECLSNSIEGMDLGFMVIVSLSQVSGDAAQHQKKKSSTFPSGGQVCCQQMLCAWVEVHSSRTPCVQDLAQSP